MRRTLAGLNNEESFSGAPTRVRPAWCILFLPRWGLSPPSHPGLRRSSSIHMSGLGLQTALGVFPERPLGPRVHPQLGKKNVVVVFLSASCVSAQPGTLLRMDGWVSGAVTNFSCCVRLWNVRGLLRAAIHEESPDVGQTWDRHGTDVDRRGQTWVPAEPGGSCHPILTDAGWEREGRPPGCGRGRGCAEVTRGVVARGTPFPPCH